MASQLDQDAGTLTARQLQDRHDEGRTHHLRTIGSRYARSVRVRARASRSNHGEPRADALPCLAEAQLDRTRTEGPVRIVLNALRKAISLRQLPEAARAERDLDRRGLPEADSGAAAVADACLNWLARAQDCSASADGGVARDFS